MRLLAATFLLLIGVLAGDTYGQPAATPAPQGSTGLPGAMLTLIEQVEVPALEAGALKELSAHEGVLVKRGDLIGRIDDSEARLALEKTKLDYDIARSKAENNIKVRYATKSHEVADAEYRRAKESETKYEKSVSATELDQLRLTVDKTALEIEQAKEDLRIDALTTRLKENEIRQAQRAIERRRIVAPLDAMVVEVKRHEGEWVQPGETVVRLIRLDRLRAEAFVAASALDKLQPGAEVRFKTSLGGRPDATFAGKIAFISPEVNPVNGQVRIWAEIDNPDLQLRPGLQGTLLLPADLEKK